MRCALLRLCLLACSSVLPSAEVTAATNALVFKEIAGQRVANLPVPSGGRPGFTLLASEQTGLSFSNVVAAERSLTNHILLNGSGVAAGDIDGDGWCDLFLGGLGGRSALYRNLGDWKFQDWTRESGLSLTNLDVTGAMLADLDGDGHLDLLVSSIRGGVHSFRNDGSGHFRETTAAAGLSSTTAAMSMTLADTDGDGALDLYVANYRNETLRDAFSMRIRVANVGNKRVITMLNGRPLVGPDLAGWVTLDEQGNIQENGQADVLYRNDGTGKFTNRAFTDGSFFLETGQPLREPLYDWTLTAAFRDLNGDGAPDLYVCCDMASPDRIWINRGDGTFQMIRTTALRKTSWFSMGVDFADLNRDGLDEIFVTDMVSREHRLRQVQVSDHKMVLPLVGGLEDRPQVPRNTLFLNRGEGNYSEIAQFSGLQASEWSWSPLFLDVDLDGWEDVLIATGFERDVQDADIANELEALRRSKGMSDAEALKMRARFPRLDLPKFAFRNRGDLVFEDVGKAWGFDTRGVGQGMAVADLDNDGDLDVVLNMMNGPVGIYRNDATAPRVAVRLRGQAPNTRGIGARIEVRGGAVPFQSQEMQAGGRYLSSDDPMRTFAAGSLTNIITLDVTWRGGKRSHLEGVHANQVVEMVEPPGPAVPRSPSPASLPALFEDRSAELTWVHREEPFDDASRQAILPRKLSQLGPGVAWTDLDGDGWEDLLVATGKGGAMGVFRNDQHGHFAAMGAPGTNAIAGRDQTTVLGLIAPSGRASLLMGTANYEDARSDGGAVLAWDGGADPPRAAVPAQAESIGPLALTDADGDGALELFVGGRVVPGRYPEAASSRLFKLVRDKWVEDEDAKRLLRGVGLVSGAVWSDLNGDGYPELILVCEWGAIRVFHNNRGQLAQEDWPVKFTAAPSFAPTPARLSEMNGWWNGVVTGDFDGDGKLDIVAGNWGQNHKYQAYRQQPARLFYGDFNQSGNVDVLEAHFDPDLRKMVPWQHFGRVGPALPFVTGRFAGFRPFGEASIAEILGDRAGEAREVRANWLESTLLLNRGDHWEVQVLPAEAQFSPAFGVVAADFDNDGHDDVFLAQNFFDSEPETSRDDAGLGLLLRGDGRGGFLPLRTSESGLCIFGEQRGAAAADFDHDGRVDLGVAQNGAAVRLFRNRTARVGVRVRLRGPPGNPTGLGAQLSMQEPRVVREVRAGAGYWSQDAAVLVIPPVSRSTSLTVRWPGGRRTEATVTPESRELVVSFPDEPPR